MKEIFEVKKCNDGEYRVIMALSPDGASNSSTKISKNSLYDLYNILREIFKEE